MLFPDQVLEEIKGRIDLADFISRYVELRHAGANYKGLCPFHQEKTPSFMVSPAKGIFKCFGCGAGGNLFTFLRDVENITFVEAVKLLARDAGVDLSQSLTPESAQKASENELLYQVNETARLFFAEQLLAAPGAAARAYLAKRELSLDTIRQFSLGFAPNAWDTLLQHLSHKGFSEQICLAAGLLVKNDAGKIYDKFRNRVMFPIVNLSGLACGFTGRVLSDADNPKYLNSPETPVYHKGNILYGLVHARDHIKKEGSTVVVEGNVDLLTLFQGGIANIVAASGTAFTETQAITLKRFCDSVTLVFDGDNAGQNAARRGINILINAGLIVRIVTLPENQDPDSYFKRAGKRVFTELLSQGRDIADFIIDRFALTRDITIPEHKSRIVKELAPLLAGISDPILRTELIKKAASRLHIQEALIVPQQQRSRPQSADPETGAGKRTAREELLERRILELLIMNGKKNLPLVRRFLQPGDFSSGSYQELLNAILEQDGFTESLLNTLGEEMRNFTSAVYLSGESSEGPEGENEMLMLIFKMRERKLLNERAQIKKELALPGADSDALNRKFSELTAQINSLKEELEG